MLYRKVMDKFFPYLFLDIRNFLDINWFSFNYSQSFPFSYVYQYNIICIKNIKINLDFFIFIFRDNSYTQVLSKKLQYKK